MDLSKKTLIGATVSLFLCSVMAAIIIFIRASQGTYNQKTVSVFELIFSLAVMGFAVATTFFMHRDGMMENKHYVIMGAIFLIGLFNMISASIIIDAFNNPVSATVSGAKASMVLPAISGIMNIPAMVGAGYLIAEM